MSPHLGGERSPVQACDLVFPAMHYSVVFVQQDAGDAFVPLLQSHLLPLALSPLLFAVTSQRSVKPLALNGDAEPGNNIPPAEFSSLHH